MLRPKLLRCRRTDACQRSLGRPGAAERGQRGSVLPIAGFDPCLGQASSLDLRRGRRDRPNDEILRFVCFPRGRRPGSALI
jgi:hypothetical protein